MYANAEEIRVVSIDGQQIDKFCGNLAGRALVAHVPLEKRLLSNLGTEPT